MNNHMTFNDFLPHFLTSLPYILLFFYNKNENNFYKLLNKYNIVYISFITFFIPLYVYFLNFFYDISYFENYYLFMFLSQSYFYIFDFFPSYKTNNQSMIIHHLIGLPLNYIGYKLSNNNNLYLIYCVYFLEQGINIFFHISKIVNYKLKKMLRLIHFKIVRIVFLFKLIIYVKILLKYHNIYLYIPLFLQLLWNINVLLKSKNYY